MEELELIINSGFVVCGVFEPRNHTCKNCANKIVQHKSVEIVTNGIGNEILMQTGSIYLWVLYDGKKPIRVLYVGMTTKSIKDRINSHKGGFNNCKDKNGYLRNAKQILSYIEEQGYKVNVLSKQSIVHNFNINNNTFNVSLCHAEEEAYLKYFRELYANTDYKLINDLKYDENTQNFI